jgi:hypothetical protein
VLDSALFEDQLRTWTKVPAKLSMSKALVYIAVGAPLKILAEQEPAEQPQETRVRGLCGLTRSRRDGILVAHVGILEMHLFRPDLAAFTPN